jgi:hypothetical protein
MASRRKSCRRRHYGQFEMEQGEVKARIVDVASIRVREASGVSKWTA